MTTPVVVITALAVLMAGGVWTLDRVALGMIRPRHKPLRRRAANLPFPTEFISIPSGDQRLFGWVAKPGVDKKGPVLVMVHGWGSNHGTMTRLAQPLLESGYPTLLFDVRHHGLSRGAPYVTARHFRDDILASIRVAQEQFPGRAVVLVGHSMGGSTGVLACANGAPVQGLVSIGAPADLWEVWSYHLKAKGLPGRWVVRALSPFWRYRAGVPWRALDPAGRIAEVDVPLLILHGEKDGSVPAHHARLFGQASGVEPRILEGWGHTDLLESPELHRILVDFLDSLPARVYEPIWP